MITKWLKMESAPKDGTYVLLCEWSGHIHIAQWCRDGYWRLRADEGDLQWHPEAWQLLPEPWRFWH